MAVKAKKKWIPDASTQRYLPFSQIRENILIMKDSSARIVLKCSTINFLLKSTEEQDAIIVSFQRFLNSLDFPIQIIVRSSKLDIDGYIKKMEDLAIKQQNPLLQNQTYEYIAYLKKLIELAQIMKKDFYIVVPFDAVEDKSVKDESFIWKFKRFWSSTMKNSDNVLKLRDQIRQFQSSKKWLATRTNSVKTSLESIGIKAKELDKTELVRLLTDYYNPRLDNLSTMKTDVDSLDLV